MAAPRTTRCQDTSRRRRLIALLLAGLAGLILLYHRPQWQRYQQHREQLLQLQREARTLHQQNQQLVRLQHELEQTRQFLQRQRRRHLLVPGEELVGRLVEVFSDRQVQIRQFRRREIHLRRYLQEVWIDVECQGPLPEVFQVVAGLERLDQPVWIEKLQLTPVPQHPRDVRCQLILRGFAGNLQHSG